MVQAQMTWTKIMKMSSMMNINKMKFQKTKMKKNNTYNNSKMIKIYSTKIFFKKL